MRVSFDELGRTDLRVGTVFESGPQPHCGADPLAQLLTVGNQGGFRIAGNAEKRSRRVALFTTGEVEEWPDRVDRDLARLTYYGDNRSPGRDLHDPLGNRLLREVFEAIECTSPRRDRVPPFFLFEKVSGGRDVVFVGLAVPGTGDADGEDLVAVWRGNSEGRFLNYRARFTLIDAPLVRREWIDSIVRGEPDVSVEPLSWTVWRDEGVRVPLAPKWATLGS